jgi:hypothetical protein
MSPQGQSAIIRKRKRKRRRRAPLFPFVLLAIAALGVLWGGVWVMRRRPMLDTANLPASYVGDYAALEQEFARYYGKALEDNAIRARFREAADLASKHNYPGASTVLETLSRDAAVPVVYSNLGITYSLLGDNARAVDMFREALVRDSDYAPVRRFLRTSPAIPLNTAEPLNREAENNNDARTANLIALRAPVSAEIGAANDTADYFRIITPPAPRDLITIELENHSINFAPRLHVYDASLRLLSWGEKTARAGESIKVSGGPSPNSSLYIAVMPEDNSSGLYVLTVTARKAYDVYEPNDDIVSSRRITMGEEINASIMDAEDTDFYSFVSPRKGTVSIEIRNTSATLIPALTTFNADRRNMGFGPELRKPGLGLHHTIDVEKDQLYYVQVWSQAASAGSYTLRVD